MTQKDAKQLFDAIKTDNLASFCTLINETDFNISFGRFPLLSVCYLYNSKNIIKKYQKQLLQIDNFCNVDEPFELYVKFRSVAGKSIRVYANKQNYVMPIEMLAVLHKDFSVFQKYKKSAKLQNTNNNLQKIYSLNNQSIKISDNKIKISRKKLSYKQKLTLIISNCSALFVVMLTGLIILLISNLYGLGTAFSPKKIFGVSDLLKLDGKNCYATMINDITVDNALQLNSFSGTLYGNNKTITINNYDNYVIDTLNGRVENVNFVYLNKTEKTLSGNYGLFVNINNGEIESVNITCNEDIVLQNDTNALTFCGIATTNNKYIHNCQLNFNAEIVSSTAGDNSLSFVSITNNGTISGCTAMHGSTLKTQNADIGSICFMNNTGAEISTCESFASLEQSTNNKDWSPNVAGICAINFGAISNCINNSNLSCSNLAETKSNSSLFVGGICAQNYSTISHCKNTGDVLANSNVITICAGGITAYTTSQGYASAKITGCASITNFNISKTDDTVFAYCGGLSGYMVGEVIDCYSLSDFEQMFTKDKQFMLGLMVGVSTINPFTEYVNISISNVHCLTSQKTEKVLPVALYNYSYVYIDKLNNADVTIHSEKTEIEQLDIYW